MPRLLLVGDRYVHVDKTNMWLTTGVGNEPVESILKSLLALAC